MAQHPREEETVRKDGYELTFYPGFLSRATIRGKDGTEHELFKQSRAYHLPKGEKKPKRKHKLRLKGGGKKQDLTLEIHDPELRIARIMVELYGSDHDSQDANAKAAEIEETLSLLNTPVLCPPNCAEPG